MAIRVRGADRDRGQLRIRFNEQGLEPRVGAAVVSDDEHVDVAGMDRSELGLGVARKQELESAEVGHEGDRGRVRLAPRRLEPARWPQYLEPQAADPEARAR